MALTQRERSTAGIVAGVAVVLGLYQFVWSPYAARSDAVDAQVADAKQQQAGRNQLFDRQHELKAVWAEMTKAGLMDNSSAAESLLLRAVLAWTIDSGVGYEKSNPDRPSDEGPFQVISYHFTCTGSTPQVSRLLSDIETAAIPVRLTEVQLAPRKEGTDQLTVQFGVSTLVLRPAAAPGKPTAVTSANFYAGDRS